MYPAEKGEAAQQEFVTLVTRLRLEISPASGRRRIEQSVTRFMESH
jgi:hypothetical protein